MVEPPTSFSTHGKTESLQVLRFDMGLHEFGAVLPDPGTRHAAKIRKSARLQEEYLEQSGLAGLAIVTCVLFGISGSRVNGGADSGGTPEETTGA